MSSSIPATAGPGVSGGRSRGAVHGGVRRPPAPDPSTPLPTRCNSEQKYEDSRAEGYALGRCNSEQKYEDSRAEAYTDLVRAWFSTSRHGARLSYARLRHTNAWLTPEAVQALGVVKSAAGFKLAEPPTDAERIMFEEGLI
jgi:hypothetical protein